MTRDNWNAPVVRTGVTALMLMVGSWAALAQQSLAQEGYSPSRRGSTGVAVADAPSLSETTALLESAVRNLYKLIEPGEEEASPNELLAYADLRSLRLYTGALEVAGWALEKVGEEYQRYSANGVYRDRARLTDRNALLAWERYQASRETVRTLLQRVRSTAILCEHQISFCDPSVAREWREEVLPSLRDCIAATDPIFAEEVAFQRYGVPGQTARVVPASGTAGVQGDPVDVVRNPVYMPYNGQGRGQGRFIEIRAFTGPVRVTLVRFESHERSFGVADATVMREVPVNVVVQPGQPIYVPCNRGRWVDLSALEVEWGPADRGRRALATIDLVETDPTARN